MKKVLKELTYTIYDNISELSDMDRKLMDKAVEQLQHAYAPYSNFHVGAALLLDNDIIHVGCNQENASYPLCICGERVALFNAAANDPKIPILTLAITAKNQRKKLDLPISPCGACRQVMVEFENRQNVPYRILLKTDSPTIYEFSSAKDLLPFSFDGSAL